MKTQKKISEIFFLGGGNWQKSVKFGKMKAAEALKLVDCLMHMEAVIFSFIF